MISGSIIGVIKGDIRSLDYGSYVAGIFAHSMCQPVLVGSTPTHDKRASCNSDTFCAARVLEGSARLSEKL